MKCIWHPDRNLNAGKYLGYVFAIILLGVGTAGAVTVPDVHGLTLTAAQAQLTALGLYVATTPGCSDTAEVNTVLDQDLAANSDVSLPATVMLTIVTGPCTVGVPDLVGLSSVAAQELLQGVNLYASVILQCSDTVPAQQVFAQNPAGGTTVNVGSAVEITVSSGFCTTVPNVVGYPEQQARQILQSAGFFVSAVSRQCSDLIAIGDVASQDPAGGTQAGLSTPVTLIVANGRCTSTGGALGNVLVPAIIGLGEVEASSRIRAAGLTPGTITRVCNPSVPAGTVMTQNPSPMTSLPTGGAVSYQVSAGPCVTVPVLTGLTESEAVAVLGAAGLTSGTVTRQCQTSGPNGLVLAQSIQDGTQVNPGTAVAFTVSNTSCVTVPDIAGAQLEEAQAALAAVSLSLNVAGSACDNNTASGILSQTPAAGALVAIPTVVDVTVSSGPCPVTVPDVVGKTEAEAVALLTTAGLTVKIQSECNNRVASGKVIRQVPLANASADLGGEVTIHVSTGKCPVIMPNVVGLPYDDARGELINAGIDPANIIVRKEFRMDIPENQVISQSPLPDYEVPADTQVTLVVSRGAKPAPPDNAEIERVLYRNFVIADVNSDGNLTFEEVLDVLPGMTEDIFNTIDRNSDGVITQEELAKYLRIGGCFGCLRNLWPFKMMAGDLLLVGISLMTLVAVSLRRAVR